MYRYILTFIALQSLLWPRFVRADVPLPPVEVIKTPIEELRKLPSEKLREKFTHSLYLRPDVRFLGAIEAIYMIYTGEDPAKAGLALKVSEKDRFHEFYQREKLVMRFPEFPSFNDLTTNLAAWAASLEVSHPLKLSAPATSAAPWQKEIVNKIDHFFAPSLISAIEQIDRLWEKGNRDPRLLALAAKATVLLSLQRMDTLDLPDSVSARSLALLVLVKTSLKRICGVKKPYCR